MTTARLLDTHCHVAAYADPVTMLRAAEEAGTAIVAVTEDPDEYRRLRTRLGRREHVDVALGLHPLRAASFSPNDLARFFRLVPQTNWIGEVGLDYSRAGASTAKAQQRVFDVVLTEAQPGRHPLTVHSRGAEKDVIRRLSNAELPAILHWYSGPLGLIDDALEAGLYFSINIAMTHSRKFPGLLPSDSSRTCPAGDRRTVRKGPRTARSPRRTRIRGHRPRGCVGHGPCGFDWCAHHKSRTLPVERSMTAHEPNRQTFLPVEGKRRRVQGPSIERPSRHRRRLRRAGRCRPGATGLHPRDAGPLAEAGGGRASGTFPRRRALWWCRCPRPGERDSR